MGRNLDIAFDGIFNVIIILMGKPEGKRPLGKLRNRWVDNIKMDLRVMGWCGVD
jgi:hypothetical protein